MKRNLLTLAVAAASLFAFSAAAQSVTDTENAAANCRKEACKKDAKQCKEACKKDAKQCKDGKPCKDAKKCKADRQRQAPNPFEGLNLTADQQAKLKEIPTPRQVAKTAAQGTDKAAGQKANAKAGCLISKDIRANYLREIRTVLTPEQYLQFLENNYINGAMKGPKHDGKHMKKDGKKGHRDGQKGHRGQKGGQRPDRQPAN